MFFISVHDENCKTIEHRTERIECVTKSQLINGYCLEFNVMFVHFVERPMHKGSTYGFYYYHYFGFIFAPYIDCIRVYMYTYHTAVYGISHTCNEIIRICDLVQKTGSL